MSSKQLIIHPVKELNSGLWRQLERTADGNSVFHHSEFVKIIAEVFRREWRGAVVVRGEEAVGGVLFFPARRAFRMVASLPFFVQSPFRFLKSQSPRSNRQLQLNREIMSAVAAWAEKQFAFTELRLPPEISDIRSFLWRNWRADVEYTAVLPLTPDSGWLENAEKDVRRVLRNASNYTIHSEIPSAELYGLLAKSYGTDRLNPPLPRQLFIRLTDKLIAAGLGKIYGLSGPEGKLLSAAFILKSHPRIYGLFLGRDIEAAASNATVILLARIAEIFRQEEYLEFDLGGAMVPAIARFKESLGAELRPCYVVRHFASPMIRSLYALNHLKGRIKRRGKVTED